MNGKGEKYKRLIGGDLNARTGTKRGKLKKLSWEEEAEGNENQKIRK